MTDENVALLRVDDPAKRPNASAVGFPDPLGAGPPADLAGAIRKIRADFTPGFRQTIIPDMNLARAS